MAIGKTLTMFLLEEQRNIPGSSGNFTSLFSDIVVAAKIISNTVNKAGLINILGKAGYDNVQGEEVQKLDEFANSTMVKVLSYGGQVAAMASEECEKFIEVDRSLPRGNYLVLFDPLDGSSNIDVNISVGTIFSIFKCYPKPDFEENDFLRAGAEQVAAGYVLYGSSTMLVYSTGNGVHGFTLDPGVGEFILSHENIRIPERGKTYSVNEGNSKYWHPWTTSYVNKLKEDSYKARYVGSLVSDFHRNLLKGGVFLYPADKRAAKGKLRLLYEANPLSFIVEQAGGMATNGKQRILDVKAASLHERTPLIIGSKLDVQEAGQFWEEETGQAS